MVRMTFGRDNARSRRTLGFARRVVVCAIAGILALAILAAGIALYLLHWSTVLSGTIISPYPNETVSGEVLWVLAIDGEGELATATQLHDEYKADSGRYFGALQDAVLAQELQVEKRIKMDGVTFRCRISRGKKLLLMGCKGYGWGRVGGSSE